MAISKVSVEYQERLNFLRSDQASQFGEVCCSHYGSEDVFVVPGVMWPSRFETWKHASARIDCNCCHQTTALSVAQQIEIARYVLTHGDQFGHDECCEANHVIQKWGLKRQVKDMWGDQWRI